MSNRIIVIGGGAAGMMAAIVANENGGDVTLIERNDRIGKKLLATGNGRCNYTNIYLTIDNYHGENNKFAYSALGKLDVYGTMDYFERLGITPAIEEDGRVFPMSLQSSSMLDIFRYEIEDSKINLITEGFVKRIEKKKEFIVKLEDGRILRGDKVILATGGMAMPVSGSDGNGYNLVKGFGHSLVKPIPGLVQLNLEGEKFNQIKGVKYPGKVSLYSNGEYIREDTGDILFTSYGISGPPVLQISSEALKRLDLGEEVTIRVSTIYTQTEDKLIEYLENRFYNMQTRSIERGLVGLIHKKLIRPILHEVKINPDKNIANISKQEIVALAKILTSWEFRVVGSQGWKHAQTTLGGLDTEYIDNRTMESKLVDGLYLVGELIDIAGDCGGFNLQWAWSSAYVAAIDATK